MSSEPPKEGAAYREQLSAALARIDALEAELAGRNGRPGNVASAKIAELERQRRELVEAGAPKKVRRTALTLAVIPPCLFGVIALAVWLGGGLSPALVFLPGMGLAIGLLIGVLHLLLTPPATRTAVAKLDAELAEARRLDALEADVRETRRLLQAGATAAHVRVADTEAEAEDDSAPATVRWVEK